MVRLSRGVRTLDNRSNWSTGRKVDPEADEGRMRNEMTVRYYQQVVEMLVDGQSAEKRMPKGLARRAQKKIDAGRI